MESAGGAFYKGNNTVTDTQNITDITTTIGNATFDNITYETTTPAITTDFNQEVKILIYMSAPTIFIIGLVGNSLTIIVMMFGPSFRKLNTGVYFLALALVDTVCLCVQRLTRTWLEMVFNIMLDITSVAGCKVLMFTHYASSCCGSWLIVAVTLERLFVVCFPLKAKVVCTRRSAVIVVIIIVLLAMLANVYTLFLFNIYLEPSDGYSYCEQQPGPSVIVSTVVDFALYSFLPSVALWIANIILITKLFTNDAFRRSSTYSGCSIRSQQQTSSTPRTSLMLLIVSFTFLLLTTPISLYVVIRAFADITETPTLFLVREVLNVLSSMNPAINFFLYCFSGPMFRRDLATVFAQCCCVVCRQKPAGTEDNDDSKQPSFPRNLAKLCSRCHCVCSSKTLGSDNEDDSSTQSSCLPCVGMSYTAPGMGSREQIYRLDSSQSLESTPPSDAVCITGAAFQYGHPP